MMLCTKCGYNAVNARGVCLNCGHNYDPTSEEGVLTAVIVFLVLALCAGGFIWSVFKFMVFNHPS
jgi:hypothetical protein